MAQHQYRLVFRGKYLPGFTSDEAIANLAHLFKVAPDRIAALLATLPATIKQKLDIETGNRYLEAIAEAGLITHLEPMDSAWGGTERRSGERRRAPDRRDGRRDAAIQPDRRGRDRRRNRSGS
jgi:hypothetical protein